MFHFSWRDNFSLFTLKIIFFLNFLKFSKGFNKFFLHNFLIFHCYFEHKLIKLAFFSVFLLNSRDFHLNHKFCLGSKVFKWHKAKFFFSLQSGRECNKIRKKIISNHKKFFSSFHTPLSVFSGKSPRFRRLSRLFYVRKLALKYESKNFSAAVTLSRIQREKGIFQRLIA